MQGRTGEQHVGRGREAAPSSRSRALVALVLAFALFAAVHGLARALALRVGLIVVYGAGLRAALALLGAACVLCAAALARELDGLRRGDACARPLAPLASLPPVLVAAWLLFLAFAQPFQRIAFDVALGVAAGAWAACVLLERRRAAPRSRAARVAGALVLGIALAAPLLELGLRAVAALHPSPLLARVGEAPRRLIERFRCAPGEERFGFACNSRGFYDEELAPRAEGELLVAAVGDSFNVGSVPHALHYTSVCEDVLGARVVNLGVAGIGPTEYVRLLVDEALPLRPSAVVISVFVGNDLDCADVEAGLPDAGLRDWLERERVLLFVLPKRLARYSRETGLREPASGTPGGTQDPTREELARRYPFTADPELEEPTLGEELFLDLETRRALAVCARDPIAFASFAASMRAARRAAGDVPLFVMLVPDEFQVADVLWERVEARAGVPLERDRPQRLCRAFLEREGIPCLDLLPLLRAVPKDVAGARHLYHLRDTHWNARGNRVAGEALAEFLRPRLDGTDR